MSLDLSAYGQRAGSGATGPVDIRRTPSVGPSYSSRSIVIPLGADTASSAAACATGTPALHAKAFPMQRTLLQAHLQNQQQHQAADKAVAGGCGAGEVTNSPATYDSAAVLQSIPAPSATAVVEDAQLHVQDVH